MTRADSTPELPETDSRGATPKQKSIPVQQSPEDAAGDSIAVVAKATNDSLIAGTPELGSTEIEVVPSEELPESIELADELFETDDSIEPISDELIDSLEDDAESTPTESGVELVEEDPQQPLKTEATDGLVDEAIDDIIAEDSDKILEAEEKERDVANGPAVVIAKRHPFRAFVAKVWSNKLSRSLVIGGSILVIFSLALVPQSRYMILNTAGVRAAVQVRVVDSGTMQPLRNVKVSAAGVSTQTDGDGNARLDKVKLGRTKLLIEKRAFSNKEQFITIGWGSNPLGAFTVSAVGSQYTFLVSDFVSDTPLEKVEATSGEGNASSDEAGKIVLTLDTSELSDDAEIVVRLNAESYRSETVMILANNKETQSVKLVADRKHVFVSKRSGKYDVYTVHVDGKNESKIVPGTGLERDDITLVPHQQDGVAALVASRENVRNADGYLLSTLYIVSTDSGDLVKIDQSEQVQIVGWSKDGHLIYVKIAAGASGADPKRHRLMSFNSRDYADTKELASSNAFNDVMLAADRVYYATSNIFQEDSTAGLSAVNPDGSRLQTILKKEVYNIFRSSYETLDISSGSSWFNYTIGSESEAEPGNAPVTQFSKVFADNPSKDFSLWVDTRDGKGVLLNYDTTAKSDTTLANRSGLKTPVYWLNENYVIFRVNDGKETADYVLNTAGGEPKKISDVTDTNGVDRWFYY